MLSRIDKVCKDFGLGINTEKMKSTVFEQENVGKDYKIAIKGIRQMCLYK